MIGARDRRVCETHTHEHTRAHTRCQPHLALPLGLTALPWHILLYHVVGRSGCIVHAARMSCPRASSTQHAPWHAHGPLWCVHIMQACTLCEVYSLSARANVAPQPECPTTHKAQHTQSSQPHLAPHLASQPCHGSYSITMSWALLATSCTLPAHMPWCLGLGYQSGPGWACGCLLVVPWGAWLALLSANQRPLVP